MSVKFSEKEMAMFNTLLDRTSENYGDNDNVSTMYKNVAMHCFITNQTGPAVDSLRRCCIAMEDCHIKRLTPEWDDLIIL